MNIPHTPLAVIIPTYNERGTIGALLKELTRLLPKADIFVIDDNSPDGTADVVRAFARTHRLVQLKVRKRKAGRGAAVFAGFRAALQTSKARIFIEMDADLSHQPAEIPRLVKNVTSDTIAIASRHIPGGRVDGWPPRRHIFSAVANTAIRFLLGLKLRDATNGFRAYPRAAVEFLCNQTLISKSYIVLSETALLAERNGFQLREVPSVFIDRRIGTSNTTFKEIIRNSRELLQLFWQYRFKMH